MVDYKDNKPPIDDITAKSYSLFDWQCYFKSIYYKKNTLIKNDGFHGNQIAFLRGYLVSHISQDLGDLAEAIREDSPSILESKIGSMFAWIFAFANELDENIEDIIRSKFPGYCPYCCRTINCDCAWWTPKQTQQDKEKDCDGPIAGEEPHSVPDTLSDWIKQLEIIYGRKYKIAMTISDIMYKLLEEKAEILGEMDKSKTKTLDKSDIYYQKLKEEIADYVTWFFALLFKLESRTFYRDDLPDYLQKKFGEHCPWCNKLECECKRPTWI